MAPEPRGKTAGAGIVQRAVPRVTGLPPGYPALLDELKQRIRAVQLKAAVSVNRELIALYWHIGKSIAERQKSEGWGKSVVDRLAGDLQREFPGVSGFSPQNIWYMRAFYLGWTDDVRNLQQPVGELDGQNLPQPVAEIPWGHNIQLITKLRSPGVRLWYARQTFEHGWSRAVLVHQIESDLFKRQGKAVTNFQATLPPPQSDLAQQVLKDPYNFDFLTLDADARERELEQGLLAHLRKFLLELGAGFAFVGEQHHLEVGGEDFYIDLLFYHLRLRCFVVIDLKMEPFKPEFAGKMNFYLSAVDDLVRHKGDQPSIGLILCKEKNRLVVEYALRDTHKPIGVSAYRTTHRLPQRLKGSLPTVEQLEAELGRPDRKGLT
jgi:predicted nuclease of restriction endonuclease-like (RecB) superfamily